MTTYNTYQEAKIANPECDAIFQSNITKEFTARLNPAGLNGMHGLGINWHACNPADYCMTVERFLADGHKFVEGDAYLNYLGEIKFIGSSGYGADACNDVKNIVGANASYILRASALEEKKPRTKVEYEKWNFECAWHAIKAFEDGEKLYTKRSHKDYILIDNAPDVLRFLYDLHERIETTMTWKEELYDYLDNSCEMSDDFDDSFTIEIEGRPLEFNLNDDEFVDMCKLVASLNSVN